MSLTDLPKTDIGPFTLFRVFSGIALSGFGGTLPWAHRELVERRAWLTEREFVETLGLGQLLPGPNICNLAVIVGLRFAGYAGAGAALAGLLTSPFVCMIALGMVYQRFGSFPVAQAALRGMSAVAAGLVLAIGLKMTRGLPRHWRVWLFGALAFFPVGLLRWPLLAVVLVLAPIAIGAAWRDRAS
ncbi:MAG: chromate transporter [Blastocatellia bacterium]|nr:MAG: chromate transporter [Blastocatellia bacterium]